MKRRKFIAKMKAQVALEAIKNDEQSRSWRKDLTFIRRKLEPGSQIF